MQKGPQPGGLKEHQSTVQKPTCAAGSIPGEAFVSRGVNFPEFKPTLCCCPKGVKLILRSSTAALYVSYLMADFP